MVAVVWTIWKSRNAACFKNKQIQDPIDLINDVCFWIESWSILQKSEDVREKLQLGVVLLRKVAADIYNAGHWVELIQQAH